MKRRSFLKLVAAGGAAIALTPPVEPDEPSEWVEDVYPVDVGEPQAASFAEGGYIPAPTGSRYVLYSGRFKVSKRAIAEKGKRGAFLEAARRQVELQEEGLRREIMRILS